MQPCIYIMASGYNGTLYVGVTSSIIHRAWQHREGLIGGFTRDKRVKMLVHFELFASMPEAILREKQIKRWNRQWKIDLIERLNRFWRDLYPEIAI
jgi:putative endonuclease